MLNALAANVLYRRRHSNLTYGDHLSQICVQTLASNNISGLTDENDPATV